VFDIGLDLAWTFKKAMDIEIENFIMVSCEMCKVEV